MIVYVDVEKRKELVREYIQRHPKATFKEINTRLHTKVNRVYPGGLAEAYEDAGIPKPRAITVKTKEEKRTILIDYVKKHPSAGGHIIRRDTKINFSTLFKTTQALFEAAGVPYTRKEYALQIKRSADARREKIIFLLKQNPLMSLEEIGKLVHAHPHSLFKNTKEMYALAGIPFIGKGDKRKIKKRKIVVDYIQRNSLATQRDINKACKTKVQELFEKGIFDAYQEAGVSFPFERLNLHGAAFKDIRYAALRFEEEIALRLSGYGTVNRLVRTKRGRADILLERNGKKIAIELKNYKSHEISISQIKQLNTYVEDIGSRLGFLICLKKPKKDTFLIGENRLFVLTESELHRIPEIIDTTLW